MDNHYSAFISYKHAPADIAVASEIQKRLERYHIPKPIRQKTGRDKIGRIFRDKEELPITSDLSDDISKALEDADFLIVICSSSTKLSTWVPREIDYFLQNHSKKQILTVLVDGEPGDVIPQQLLTDTVTRTAPDGTSREETIRHEPLSCDFRSGIREARRTEIPRLAAALLGCTYDELMMRERQYKRRRNLSIGIPAICALTVAVGYLIWSRQEIAKNYQEAQANLRQAMINQSEYLCTQADELWEDGDRLRAIMLAMESLPSENNDRPLVSASISRLSRFLDAYSSNDRMRVVAEFSVSGDIENFSATKNGQYLAILDSYGIVHVWNAWTYDKLHEIGPLYTDAAEASGDEPSGAETAPEDGVPENDLQVNGPQANDPQANDPQASDLTSLAALDMKFLSNDRMIILTREGVYAYEIATGEVLWRYKDDSIAFHKSGIDVWTDSEEVVLALTDIVSQYDAPADKTDYTGNLYMVSIDARSGEVNGQAEIKAGWEELLTIDYISASTVSGDAAVVLHGNLNEQPEVWVWKRGNGTLFRLKQDREVAKVQAVYFPNEYRAAVLTLPADGGEGADANDAFTMTRPREILVSCYDMEAGSPEAGGSEAGSTIWESSFFSPQINLLETGNGLEFIEELRDEKDLLVCLYANKAAIYRLADGSLFDEIENTASIVMSDVTVSNGLRMYLEDGSLGQYGNFYPVYEENGVVVNLSYFSFHNLGFTFITREDQQSVTYMVRPDSNRIWLCDSIYDEDFTRWNADPLPDETIRDAVAATDHAVFFMDSSNKIFIYDSEDQKPVETVDLGEGNNYTFIGSDAVADTLWLYCGFSNEPDSLIRVFADGTVKTTDFRPGVPKNEFLPWMYVLYRKISREDADRLIYAGLLDSLFCSRALPVLLEDNRLAWQESTCLKTGHIENDSLVTETSCETGHLFESFFLSSDEKKALLIDPGLTALLAEAEAGNYDFEGEPQNVLLIQDLETGEHIELAEVLYGDPVLAVWSGDGTAVAVTDGQDVAVYSADGKLIRRISVTGHNVISMSTTQDELAVLYGGGYLTRFAWADAGFRGQSVISHHTEQYGDTMYKETFSRFVDWKFTEDKLYLNRYGPDRAFMVINLSDWEEEQATGNLLCYDYLRDRLISWEKDPETGGYYLGWFPLYSVEDLRRKAEKALHGMTLTPEERKLYGLSE